MVVHPLTHHDILGLVAPFARRGRHVDLPASDRMARRVAFRPVEHGADGDRRPALVETLALEHPEPGWFELTRTLRLADGLQATLVTEGGTAAEVLERVEAVPLERQLVNASGYALVRSYRAEGGGSALSDGVRLLLVHAHARVADLEVTVKVPKVGGIPAEIAITPPPGDAVVLPEDLLAVLGWPWTRLTKKREVWTGQLRLRGNGIERTRDAEAKLDRMLTHLAHTLAESPQRFHDRLRGARWAVTFRRAVPLLACFAMLAVTGGIASLDLAENSVWRMLMFHAPPLLLMLFFVLPEMPHIEVPPLPRRPKAESWRSPAP